MDQRMAQILGYGSNNTPGLGQTLYSGMFGGGLPQPITQGGAGYTPDKRNAPVYSSAGVPTGLNTPWNAMSGVMRPGSMQGGTFNPGTADPMLRATVQAGHAGGIDRGAAAFLGAGYNPWARETNNQGEVVSPSGQG